MTAIYVSLVASVLAAVYAIRLLKVASWSTRPVAAKRRTR